MANEFSLKEMYPRFVELKRLSKAVPELNVDLLETEFYFELGVSLKEKDETIIDLDELLKHVRLVAKKDSYESVLPLLKFLYMTKVMREADEVYNIDKRLPLEYQMLCVAREYYIDMSDKDYDKYQIIEITKGILEIARNLARFSSNNTKCFYMMYVDVLHDLVKDQREHKYQQLFKQNGPTICGGKISYHPHQNCHHIPDAWIEKDEEYIPVEVKLGDFNKSALEQLRRYMKTYKCEHGIAVGRKCTVSLDDNIQFISLKTLEKCEKKDLFLD